MKVDVGRRWLDHNKIFFETVGVSALTIMAVVVSVAQASIARRQTALMDLQTRLQRETALPRFVLLAVLVPNDGGERATDEELHVYNYGNLYTDLAIETAVFVDVTRLDRGLKATTLPIGGYYFWQSYVGYNDGLIRRFGEYHNNAKRSDLETAFLDHGNLAFRRYAHLVYRDIFGASHEEFYFVQPIVGGRKIDDAEGKSIFAMVKDFATLVEFDKLDIDLLLSLTD